ncbi:MAG: hypothetical protein IEMM0006_2166 [bacterium]|nr:MAG: hypothetical protein IEMM0006_2166 [bacterium]
MLPQEPTLIPGGTFSDQRGTLRFVNDFLMNDVIRFYIIRHNNTELIRAWQAHKQERKYFYVLKGRFVVAYLKLNKFDNPDMSLKPEYTVLSELESKVLALPEGYANGLKALEPDAEIMVFSNLTVEESQKDDYRFPAEWWFDWERLEPKTRN